MNTWFTLNKSHRLSPLNVNFNSGDTILNYSPHQDKISTAIETVRIITEKFPPPYNVFMSGGIDSQVMVYAWSLSGVDFNIVHFKYDGWNQHDTDSVLNFVDKNNLKSKLDIRNFSVLDFITSDKLKEYAKKFDCASPQILTYIRLIEETEGTVILAGNNIQVDTAGLNYSVAGLYRYGAQTGKQLVPLFHLYQPNFAYCLFQSNIEWKKLSLEESYALRVKLYKEAKFQIYPQASKKTGFEKIKIYFDTETISLHEKLKWQGKMSKRPFDIMFRYRLFDEIGDYSDSVKLEHHAMINRLINGTEHENTY